MTPTWWRDRREDGPESQVINADFETIIPGLAAAGMTWASSFTDTKEREKTVDFVDLLHGGISFYAKSSAKSRVETVGDSAAKGRGREARRGRRSHQAVGPSAQRSKQSVTCWPSPARTR